MKVIVLKDNKKIILNQVFFIAGCPNYIFEKLFSDNNGNFKYNCYKKNNNQFVFSGEVTNNSIDDIIAA